MAFKKLGKEKSGKKWRAWSTEGCNWRWVNRWKKKTLLFFLSLLNDFTKCAGGKEDESKKNPFHSFKKKKMSLIVSIRSLCCMWYGWIKAGYFYILFFGLVWSGCYFWMARERKNGVCLVEGGECCFRLDSFRSHLLLLLCVETTYIDRRPLMDNFLDLVFIKLALHRYYGGRK